MADMMLPKMLMKTSHCRSLSSCFVLDRTDDGREYRAARATRDRLCDDASHAQVACLRCCQDSNSVTICPSTPPPAKPAMMFPTVPRSKVGDDLPAPTPPSAPAMRLIRICSMLISDEQRRCYKNGGGSELHDIATNVSDLVMPRQVVHGYRIYSPSVVTYAPAGVLGGLRHRHAEQVGVQRHSGRANALP